MSGSWVGLAITSLEMNEIRLFGLMTERLFLDPIEYGNELKYGYFWVGEGSLVNKSHHTLAGGLVGKARCRGLNATRWQSIGSSRVRSTE